jgi:formamidopyrimidine-DNA glycosylase
MPELPDIVVYIEALERRILGHVLEQIQAPGPSLLRTANPPLGAVFNHRVAGLRRIGKRIAIGFDNDLWLVLHLMIAGRLHWSEDRVVPDGRRTLAAFDFDNGTLTLTEAGTRKRASLHLLAGAAELAEHDPGGIDVLSAGPEQFSAALTAANHTLKRALTDPRLFSGIGNAYSDEILFHAQLSPVALTQRLKPEEISRLYEATRNTLTQWVQELRAEVGDKFPKKLRPFTIRWPYMGNTECPARDAVPRCRASVMPRMKPTTAPTARPEESCWQTAPLAASCAKIGRAPWRNWKSDWAVDLAPLQPGKIAVFRRISRGLARFVGFFFLIRPVT